MEELKTICQHVPHSLALGPWSMAIEESLFRQSDTFRTLLPAYSLRDLQMAVRAQDWHRMRAALSSMTGKVPISRLWQELVRCADRPVEAISHALQSSAQVSSGLLNLCVALANNRPATDGIHSLYRESVEQAGTANGIIPALESSDAPTLGILVQFLAWTQVLRAQFSHWLALLSDKPDASSATATTVPPLPFQDAKDAPAGISVKFGPYPDPELRGLKQRCTAAAPPMTPGGGRIKVGAAWNVFDGEELLEHSIRSVADVTHYRVAVYQT